MIGPRKGPESERPWSLLSVVTYVESSLQTETEQNSEAILEQLRDESDHSKSLELAPGRICVLAMQHRPKVVPMVAVCRAVICIKYNAVMI